MPLRFRSGEDHLWKLENTVFFNQPGGGSFRLLEGVNFRVSLPSISNTETGPVIRKQRELLRHDPAFPTRFCFLDHILKNGPKLAFRAVLHWVWARMCSYTRTDSNRRPADSASDFFVHFLRRCKLRRSLVPPQYSSTES